MSTVEAPVDPAARQGEVMAVLDTIHDPCSISIGRPIGLVGMGIIENVDVVGGAVTVSVLPTFPDCMFRTVFEEKIEESLCRLGWCERVSVRFCPADPGVGRIADVGGRNSVARPVAAPATPAGGRPVIAAAASGPVRVDRAALAAMSKALLRGAGASAENASVVVEHLLEADAMGLKSHGIIRVPQYLADIAAGGIDPVASPKLIRTAPGRVAADGNNGFGQVVGVAMAKEAARLAAETGVAFVTGRHMGHTGRIGAYPEFIAAAGMVGIVVCSGPRHGHWVAPFGGREGRLATNPIAYAFPVKNGPPVVADFSTSVVPEGVVRSLKNRGLTAPEGALRDAAGNATTDPSVLYAEPKGTIQPFGGAFGYRGTALGILVDVLAALLADDDADDPKRDGSNLAMIAIAADDVFAGRAGRMARYIGSSPPLDPKRPVMLPGQREQEEAARAGNGPILVDRPTWDALAAAAEAERIPVPNATGA